MRPLDGIVPMKTKRNQLACKSAHMRIDIQRKSVSVGSVLTPEVNQMNPEVEHVHRK